MALLGGGVGGAGNPVGGSFTGPAQALEIIGDLGYAYSGAVGVGAGDVTMLSLQLVTIPLLDEFTRDTVHNLILQMI